MKTIIPLLLVLCLLQACNTHKKATRHLIKATTTNKLVVDDWCGKLYPPVTLIKDSVVYKPGKSPRQIYVYADCDSLIRLGPDVTTTTIKIPCPPVIQTDTVFLFKEKQLVNRAEVEQLAAELNSLTITNVELRTTKNILLYLALTLGLYTGVRWLLRIWNIKLP